MIGKKYDFTLLEFPVFLWIKDWKVSSKNISILETDIENPIKAMNVYNTFLITCYICSQVLITVSTITVSGMFYN